MDRERLHAEIDRSMLRFIAGVVLHNQLVAQRLGLGASDSQFVSLINLHGPLPAGGAEPHASSAGAPPLPPLPPPP